MSSGLKPYSGGLRGSVSLSRAQYSARARVAARARRTTQEAAPDGKDIGFSPLNFFSWGSTTNDPARATVSDPRTYEKALERSKASAIAAEKSKSAAEDARAELSSHGDKVKMLLEQLQQLNDEAQERDGSTSMMVPLKSVPEEVVPMMNKLHVSAGLRLIEREVVVPPQQEPETSQRRYAPPPDDGTRKAEGSGREILLQAFNWESHKGDYYSHVCKEAKWYASLGFTYAWLPPPTASVSNEGYMPTDYYNLNSCYGSEDALRGAVGALKEAGIKTAGDCVLNHRCALHQNEHGIWNVFGGKLDWDATAICRDDQHFHGRGNTSTGDMFHAAPNVDHTQPFVRDGISEWLAWLRMDIGIDGYRLDFAKGFSGKFVKEYCERSVPDFVVGEYWDSLKYHHGVPDYNQDEHRQRIIDWINAADGQATAFDVTTKGILHDVFGRGEYWRLRDQKNRAPGVLGWWPSRTTTFLENHDTGSTQGHWRFPHHALEQGYCYILTHPGTPTVFYDHLHDEPVRRAIETLVQIRRSNGIHVRSSLEILRADQLLYAAMIDDKVLMKIGPDGFQPGAAWRLAGEGNCWSVWERE